MAEARRPEAKAPLPTAVFYLPRPSQLETSSYNLTGSGAVAFSRLDVAVSAATSYNTLPAVAQPCGTRTLAPGNAYTVASFACPAGRAVAFAMGAARGDASTALRYFQDYNPCPTGLFIAVS